MPETKSHLWERLPAESNEEWELFDLYLHKRSVTDVARLYFGQDGLATEGAVLAGRTYCQRLKKENQWEMRVAAYDRWTSKQRDQATATIIKRHAALLGRKRMKMLSGVMRQFDRAVAIMDKLYEDEIDQKAEDRLHLGLLNMLASAHKMIAAEMKEVEKANPLEEVADTTQSMEVLGAQDELMRLIDKREKGEKKTSDKEEIA